MSGDQPSSASRVTDELRLHPEHSSVTRLSRKVVVGLAGMAVIVVCGALIFALDGRRGKQENATELYNTEHKTTADELARLPRDYTGIPRDVPPLGPRLPGDFGRTALQERGPQGIDSEQQRVAQESEAARTSRLFASSSTVSRYPASAPSSPQMPISGSDLLTEKPPIDPDALQNMQDRKLAFLNAPVDKRTVSTERLQNPASKYIVQAGTVIPAALITGIRSDLPGQVTAQVACFGNSRTGFSVIRGQRFQ